MEHIDTVRREAEDAEWAERIARRREHRPEQWTVYAASDAVRVLSEGAGAVLLDSVSGWLSALLERLGPWVDSPSAKDDIAAEVDLLVGAWATTGRLVVAVSDEVGAGPAPSAPERRIYRDVLGLLNQRLAASADQVWLVTAGIPVRLR